jgi:hypothetical protein
MQFPVVAPTPIVTTQANIFWALFKHRYQFQHFQNDLMRLSSLHNKSLSRLTCCMLESADKTNLSHFFSDAPSFLPLNCRSPSLTQGNLTTKTNGEARRQPAQGLIEALILYAQSLSTRAESGRYLRLVICQAIDAHSE